MIDGVREVVLGALEEDAAADDVTTIATVPADARGTARLVAREPCTVAGLDAFCETFLALDPTLSIEVVLNDGASAGSGDVIARVSGAVRPILTAERTALNFVQRLSGIASLTRAFVRAAAGARILDTRKTTPGLRALEKAAVLAGGGSNHRANLSEAILIKDNHILAARGLVPALERARATGRAVEIECDTLAQVRAALEAGANHVLLDNMDLETLRDAVVLCRGRARTEASGGVTLDSVAAIAATGVDDISVGALTHSARAIDLSLEIEVA